ncbi:MAG: thioredoxin family protein [candidate division Zixibacteria bacterium]
MSTNRKIEVFTAGCALCNDAVDLVKKLACPSCNIEILDMNNDGVTTRAKNLGIRAIPAVAIDGKLVDCCGQSGIDPGMLIEAGLGKPIA